MNKGGVGLGGGASGGGGSTAGAAAAAAQKQKALLQRVDADVGNLVDNFGFLVNVARVNDPPVRNSQESFMMEMRAARMVQAADSLLKLVSELKQTAIFSGFASLNDHVDQRTESSTNCLKTQILHWQELEKRRLLASRSSSPITTPRLSERALSMSPNLENWINFFLDLSKVGSIVNNAMFSICS